MKKLTSYLIAFMMVFAMIPGIVFADTEVEGQNAENTVFYMEYPGSLNGNVDTTVETINIAPLNEEDDAIMPNTSGSVDYATTIEGAGSLLREGMVNRQSEITVGYRMDEWSNEAFSNAVDAIMEEAEEHTGVPVEGDYLRWVKGPGSITGSCSVNGAYYYATITFSMTYYTTADQEEEVDAAVSTLLAEIITDDMSDYEKIEAIYDYMTSNISYDYENLNNSDYMLKHTAYAALINKTSVCQGYAVLFYRLALECGIDARYISGDATNSSGETGGHGWNIVKLGEKYYLADATWDTSRANVGIPYDYFLKATYSDHTADEEYLTDPFTANYPMATEDYVPCTNHIAEVIPAVEATCSTTGWTEGSKCSNCGKILVAQQFISEKSHTFSGEWWSNGFTHWKVCSCGAKGEEAEHTKVTTTVEPTCEEIGWTIETCTVCGQESSSSIPELPHDTVQHEGKAATCTENGWSAYETCTRCEYTTYNEILATGHSYTSVVTAPTCTAEGDTTYTCACGHSYVGDKVAKVAHTWASKYTVDKAASFKAAGSKSYHCAVCGAAGDSVTIPKLKSITGTSVVVNGSARTPNPVIKDAKGKKLVRDTDYTVVYKNKLATKVVKPKFVGRYTAVVTFKGNYSGTKSVKFDIKPKSTTQKPLAKPGKKQIKVTWVKKPAAQVNGYQIRYSTMQNMDGAKVITVKGAKVKTKTIRNLKAKKKYYVQVRTYKTVGGVKIFSNWSNKRFIITK